MPGLSVTPDEAEMIVEAIECWIEEWGCQPSNARERELLDRVLPKFRDIAPPF